MPVFPPQTAVTVLVDGRPLATYASAYLRGGRVYAPVDPLLLRLADRVWFVDGAIVVVRGERRIRIPLEPGFTEELAIGYVPVGPVLRALGDRVVYHGKTRRLDIRTPSPETAASPTPFAPGTPQPARSVFTPQPVPTVPPVWHGPPLPRRTPLPAPSGV
ncbi:MAG: hypothetical protein JO199_05095 [Candidatus Eremiobacteraeota bacterium]|nr:hypothetical protein [Candidatus Eremiobacteraeota bacterium]